MPTVKRDSKGWRMSKQEGRQHCAAFFVGYFVLIDFEHSKCYNVYISMSDFF